MGWFCKKAGDFINVFCNKKFQGNYVLMKDPYCKMCACPEVTTDSCKHNHSLDGFNRAYAIGIYYPARLNKGELLSSHILKLKTDPDFAIPLGMSLGIVINELYPELLDSDYLVPIPLSDEEFANRGYNQSTELTKVLSEAISVPLVNVLQKTRTQSMRMLDWSERQLAVTDLYRLQGGDQVKEKHVLLVDDVMTTGLTFSQCGNLLRSMGARSVNVITAGRTIYTKGPV